MAGCVITQPPFNHITVINMKQLALDFTPPYVSDGQPPIITKEYIESLLNKRDGLNGNLTKKIFIHPSLYNQYNTTNKVELLYLIKHQLHHPPTCKGKGCDGRPHFRSFRAGYLQEHCSTKCAANTERYETPDITKDYIKNHLICKNRTMLINFLVRRLDLTHLFSKYKTDSTRQILYLIYNGMSEPARCKSPHCDNYTNYIDFSKGYTAYCSPKCSANAPATKQNK